MAYRSEQISFSTETYFNCNETQQTIQNSWAMDQLDPNISSNTDYLLNNPTANSSCLVIQSNTLVYGLYKITFYAKIILKLDGKVYGSNVSTYIRVVPTGIVVNALESGVQRISIGSNQTLIFNPVFYSFDLDNIVSPQSLSFIFFCQTINANETFVSKENIDLYQYNMNSSLIMNSNLTCFDSNSKLLLFLKLKNDFNIYVKKVVLNLITVKML